MARINLAAPWDKYYNKMMAFFAEDSDVTILYDSEAKNIKVLVQDPAEAEALMHLLNSEVDFGGVKLLITVVPANETTGDIKKFFSGLSNEENYTTLYQRSLMYNNLYAYTKTIENIMGFNAVFIVFKKQVVQYYNDNLGDLNGMKSTLAENIARDIFVPHNGVFFCTDTDDVNVLHDSGM